MVEVYLSIEQAEKKIKIIKIMPCDIFIFAFLEWFVLFFLLELNQNVF